MQEIVNSKQAFDAIKKYDTIIIHRHNNPDGDAIGSQTGLKLTLQANFPNKRIYAVGDDAKRFSFVDGCESDVIDDSVYDGALAILLDTSAKSLISDERFFNAECTVRIDHHIYCEDLAQIDIDDTSFESCCGLIVSLLQEWGMTIPQKAAQALYTGMVTDSGRFRYDSTTPCTLRNAAYLLECGAVPTDIYNKLYADDYDMLKLRASFVLSIKFTENHVAYIYTPIERMRELLAQGVSEFTVSRGMVNTMAEIKGVETWVNFTESENGVLCEVRSKSQNVNQIAVAHGGGGHIKASGATLKDKAEAMQVLEELNNIVQQL